MKDLIDSLIAQGWEDSSWVNDELPSVSRGDHTLYYSEDSYSLIDTCHNLTVFSSNNAQEVGKALLSNEDKEGVR